MATEGSHDLSFRASETTLSFLLPTPIHRTINMPIRPLLAHRTLRGLMAALALGLVPPAVMFGQGLASVEDTLYTEVLIAGSNVSSTLVILRANGLAHSIGSRVSGPGVNYQTKFTPSQELTYVYTPPTEAEPSQATLQFAGGTGAPLGGVLSFQTPKSGSIAASTSFAFKTRFEHTSAANVSNRFWIRPGETGITGFVLDKPRLVLVRGIGPGLTGFGVPAVAADPSITVFTDDEATHANDDWDTGSGPDAQAMAWLFGLVGAFRLTHGSTDAALHGTFGAGAHTVHVHVPDTAAPGEVLTEVYVIPFD